MRPCVLIPTYQNARTLESVVSGALEHCLDVIVVDDGSTDETPAILERFPGIKTLRHERNRGKGVALRTGFESALGSGYTHAITVDADGQHPTAELPRFLEEAGAHPAALVIGNRDLVSAGAGPGSRLGRKNSNFWTWVETGLRLPDTQSGYRGYPLGAIGRLHLGTRGFDLEIEVLVKAAWLGVPVRSIEVPVRYFSKEERVSHLRPFVDFLRIGNLNVKLVLLRFCLPAPFLTVIVQRRFRTMTLREKLRETGVELFLREPGSPRRIALSVSLGLFMGIAPIWGFQIAATLLAAHLTGLSKPVAVVASHISVPIMIPPILYASLLLGRLALGRPHEQLTTLDLAPADVPAWILGSFLLAAAASLVGGVLSYWIARGAQRARRARRTS